MFGFTSRLRLLLSPCPPAAYVALQGCYTRDGSPLSIVRATSKPLLDNKNNERFWGVREPLPVACVTGDISSDEFAARQCREPETTVIWSLPRK